MAGYRIRSRHKMCWKNERQLRRAPHNLLGGQSSESRHFVSLHVLQPATSMDDQLLSADGTNARPLFCRRCGSQFLAAGKARHEEHEASRAHLQRVVNVAGGKAKDDEKQPAKAKTETEVVASCWRVDDMWDFDNFGQSRPVAGAATSGGGEDLSITPETVYVVCADCEKGPVGVRWRAGEPYYLAHSLLAYEPKEGAPVNGSLPAGMSEEFVR